MCGTPQETVGRTANLPRDGWASGRSALRWELTRLARKGTAKDRGKYLSPSRRARMRLLRENMFFWGQTLLAQNSSARERLTEHRNHGQNYGGILVIYPFL